ncbi:MAG: hypothetical protein IJF32_06595 [Oscillospiraceae bacterium]|nr:hypothetical protein [Oscillospiraceae bacterium]MBQ6902425.1 hypothetical protein [Oscillospiraceae bacterium]
MSIQQNNFKTIADSIRICLGTGDAISPSSFAEKVSAVYEKGYEKGLEEMENKLNWQVLADETFDIETQSFSKTIALSDDLRNYREFFVAFSCGTLTGSDIFLCFSVYLKIGDRNYQVGDVEGRGGSAGGVYTRSEVFEIAKTDENIIIPAMCFTSSVTKGTYGTPIISEPITSILISTLVNTYIPTTDNRIIVFAR